MATSQYVLEQISDLLQYLPNEPTTFGPFKAAIQDLQKDASIVADNIKLQDKLNQHFQTFYENLNSLIDKIKATHPDIAFKCVTYTNRFFRSLDFRVYAKDKMSVSIDQQNMDMAHFKSIYKDIQGTLSAITAKEFELFKTSDAVKAAAIKVGCDADDSATFSNDLKKLGLVYDIPNIESPDKLPIPFGTFGLRISQNQRDVQSRPAIIIFRHCKGIDQAHWASKGFFSQAVLNDKLSRLQQKIGEEKDPKQRALFVAERDALEKYLDIQSKFISQGQGFAFRDTVEERYQFMQGLLSGKLCEMPEVNDSVDPNSKLIEYALWYPGKKQLSAEFKEPPQLPVPEHARIAPSPQSPPQSSSTSSPLTSSSSSSLFAKAPMNLTQTDSNHYISSSKILSKRNSEEKHEQASSSDQEAPQSRL